MTPRLYHSNDTLGLPTEMLAKIFLAGIQDQSDFDARNEKHWGTLCSHVCKRWRNLAIQTPELWSQIICTHPMEPQLWKLWIKRCHRGPLDIIIMLKKESGDLYDLDNNFQRSRGLSTAVLDLITPHIHRWHSLRLEIDFQPVLVQLWSQLLSAMQPSHCAPTLESVVFACVESSYWDTVIFPSSFPEVMPAIKEVVISALRVDWWKSIPYFTGLVHLKLEGTNVTDHVLKDILLYSPALKSLYLKGPLEDPLPNTEVPLALHHLMELCIEEVRVTTALIITTYFRVPILVSDVSLS